MKRIVILISGRGSNLESIVRAARTEQWPASVVGVVTNRRDADGLRFAEAQRIPTRIVDHTQYPDRAAFDVALQEVVDGFAPDWVVLAGFMRILTSAFVLHYLGRLINIHPSLLPAFPGLATHRQALAAGVATHGATVHFVTPELDHGPTIAQATVPVLPGDTETSLAERVLEQEHLLYPRALRACIEGEVVLEDGAVRRLVRA